MNIARLLGIISGTEEEVASSTFFDAEEKEITEDGEQTDNSETEEVLCVAETGEAEKCQMETGNKDKKGNGVRWIILYRASKRN